ncbi:SAM domain and HD [Mactra antiquata]
MIQNSPSIIIETIINDPIHGTIQLHPLCLKIIDTPEFQRLRYLKQIGTTYFVYPGASHDRFEHSIGVCHLAGKFVEILKANQPDLDIDDEDVLCLKIAGLCHDLGHGPFSHVFEHIVSEIRGDQEGEEKWKHEIASINMFDHLIKENKLDDEFGKYNLKEKEKEFIKQLIYRKPYHEDPEKEDSAREEKTGHGKDKEFLYQIVANQTNGLDVDKWEYFARDCYMLGISNNFDYGRCMQLARVMKVDDRNQICFRDKERFDLIEMFHSRYTLHKRACKHKTGLIIDIMITDALKAANEHYRKFPGSNGKLLTMSEAIDDMKAYTHLTDDIINDIRRSTADELKDSREIFNRLAKRDLYKCICRKTRTVGDAIGKISCEPYYDSKNKLVVRASSSDNLFKQVETEEPKGEMTCTIYHDLNGGRPIVKPVLSDDMLKHFKEKTQIDENTIKEGMMKLKPTLPKEQFIIKIAKFDYGSGNKNPIENVTFFDKQGQIIEERNQAGRVRINQLICEWDVLVLYKRSSNTDVDVEVKKKEIKEAFEEHSKDWI